MLDRELGDKVPVSIGTAIALEALLDLPRARKEDHMFMNMRTLWRNFYGSFADTTKLKETQLLEPFLEELELIESTIVNGLDGNWTPVFYIMSAKSLAKQLPHAKLKIARTPKQIDYAAIETYVLSKVVDHNEWEERVQVFDTLVRGGNTKALMISHYPLDLLSKGRFKSLMLLESHTGAVKPREQWGTKLTTNKDYNDLPFNIMMVQLLGDGSNQLLSLGPKFKKPLLEIAAKKKWHANTTDQKIKFDIRGTMKDKFLADILLSMLSTKLK